MTVVLGTVVELDMNDPLQRVLAKASSDHMDANNAVMRLWEQRQNGEYDEDPSAYHWWMSTYSSEAATHRAYMRTLAREVGIEIEEEQHV